MRTTSLLTPALLVLVLTAVACSPEFEEESSESAISAGTLPLNVVQTGGLTWYRDNSALRTNAETASYCNGTSLLGYSGWRQPTQAEVNNFVANRPSIPNYDNWIAYFGNYLMSNTPYGAGMYGIRLSDGSSFSSNGVGYNPCVRSGYLYDTSITVQGTPLPVNVAQNGGLTWYRDNSAFRNSAQTASYCSSTSLLGYTGWRQPTQAEVNAFFAARGTIGNYTYWINFFGNYLVSSTPYGSGTYGARMLDGSAFVMGPGNIGYNPCVRAGSVFTTSGAYTPPPPPALPLNVAQTGGLTWYRDNSALRTNAETATYCNTSALLGYTGWRQPTQAEVQAFYANRASIGNYTNWINYFGNYLMSNTPYGAGMFGLRMTDGSSFVGTGVGYNPCVRAGYLY